MGDKMSKELRDIQKAISAYIEKHDYDVVINASFMAFKGKDCKVVDDRIFSFGDKKTLILDLKDHLKMVRKEKDEYVCW